jgi:methylated-DNA-[protein]-cysteine S-methyltransferase
MSKPTALALQAQTRIATPLGPLTAARSAAGLAGLWFDAQRHHPGAIAAPWIGIADDAVLAQTAALLADYFAGRPLPAELGGLPLAPQGTDFQQAVWRALRQIPSGQSRSYSELAAALGTNDGARAVGAAVGRNPISVLVPCHRVLGADGSLTGYAGGVERKQALLALERHPLAGRHC